MRTKDELLLADKIQALIEMRQRESVRYADALDQYNRAKKHKEEIEATVSALTDSIELMRQGQMILGDL